VATQQFDSAPLAPLRYHSTVPAGPLRWLEHEGEPYLVAPKSWPKGRRIEPLDDADLSARFVQAADTTEALAEFFQAVGHPTDGVTRTVSASSPFFMLPAIRLNALTSFKAQIELLVTLLAGVGKDVKHAKDFVVPLPRSGGWRLEHRAGSVHFSRTLRADTYEGAWVASRPFDERRLLAFHVFVHQLIQELVRERLLVVPSIRRTAPFQVEHPLNYQPRDLLGAILLQVLSGLGSGEVWSRCAECQRPMLGNRKRETCSDRCRQRRRRSVAKL
jgi:hypothetical protein